MNPRMLASTALVGLLLGAILALASASDAANAVWAAVIVLLIVPETIAVVRTLRAGRLGVDSIALLAMATALAMEQYLAGAVVALMLSGGNALEDWAAGRSRRELRALLERAPMTAHRLVGDAVEEVAVESLVPGDLVSVRPSEVIPVDGLLESTRASVDESALTGESLPVDHARGGRLRSGTTNGGEPFELRATATAAESSYARLVELVRSAEADRAPFVRMADRFAVWLLVLTLAIGGGAWLLSGESIRFLAVLVVATPCPLILAAPIAFIAGISRAAARGIIVKSGGAIEALGRARSVLLDKTGTLTFGQPRIEAMRTADGFDADEMLRLAASVDQMSTHVLAESLVSSARARGLELTLPSAVEEIAGEGIRGVVEGRPVLVGTARLLARELALATPPVTTEDSRHAHVFVAVDEGFAGTILLADQLRSDAARVQPDLLAEGVRRVTMLTGDHGDTARFVAESAGISEVRSEQSPEDKVAAVREFQSDPELRPVVMVGDGINDAPALATAEVGVAMSMAGVTASAEAADVVVTVPEISRVVEAIQIGRRSHAIALQSVVVGIGLSVVAMGFAAVGAIPPVAGALLQEVIDVAVILNALRALR
jgi:heavy metal translocating P-type ATPase